jgi:predicted enzyme related to lactoylglutathione lyase
MANAFCHMELGSTDVAKAKTFYTTLFDWQLNDVDMGPMGTYTLIKPAEGPGGGMMKQPVPGAPSSWLPYVLVPDIKTATAKAKSLGAQIMKDSQEVPNEGWFTIILDPTGAALGLWQAKAK